MLNVQEFLLTHSFDELLSLHGVKARPSVDGTKWSLNYDQILAKDSDPIACECRGLVIRPSQKVESLESVVGETTILFRCMGRFFNLGDPVAAKLDWAGQVWAEDKMDGTMCGLYWDPYKPSEIDGSPGMWCVCTRSVPEADLPFDEGLSILDKNTYYELFKYCVKNTLNKIYDKPATEEVFQKWLDGLYKSYSYTYEATSPLNRIVVKYDDYLVTLLAARCTATGEYTSFKEACEDLPVWVDRLEALEDGWDADGEAPKPSDSAITKAVEIYDQVIAAGLSVESIDADAMGGVDLYLQDKARTWIYIRNEGTVSMVSKLSNGGHEAKVYQNSLLYDLEEEYMPGPALTKPLTFPFNGSDDIVRYVNTLNPSQHEGVVLVDRHYNRVKVKSSAWVLASRAKDAVTMSRRGALEAIIKGNIDDVLPLLDDKVANAIIELRDRFRNWLVRIDYVRGLFHKMYPVRKDFALALKASEIWSTPYFALYDRRDVMVHDWLIELDKAGKLTPSLLDSLLEAIK